MVQRFYFDLTNGDELIRDDEGVEATVLNEAIVEAQSALDEVRRNGDANMLGDNWQMLIRDEDGATLKTLPLD